MFTLYKTILQNYENKTAVEQNIIEVLIESIIIKVLFEYSEVIENDNGFVKINDEFAFISLCNSK